ncbi:Hypothetical protein ORPV_372 [Orpheovirus IHUMI-LCC2]|uniref:Uncharacterized protein n=1 Tax=Orpheovirus IHUMI-LCC2 TaxID=2023057 RepID=A0A2I2L410_9VIRU|nr:Hypothetical protein ORPV_372 [Orpheovirus IHUMI-LCC2]SNW62276.1 Hypothetical protein ORPV_372 [Orpheovirus IHUMI-LCC2]
METYSEEDIAKHFQNTNKQLYVTIFKRDNTTYYHFFSSISGIISYMENINRKGLLFNDISYSVSHDGWNLKFVNDLLYSKVKSEYMKEEIPLGLSNSSSFSSSLEI